MYPITTIKLQSRKIKFYIVRRRLKGLRKEIAGIKILNSAIITAPANRENKTARAGCSNGFILQFHSHLALFSSSYFEAWISVDYIFFSGLLALAIMSSIMNVY